MNASLLSWEVRYRVGYLHTQRFVPSLPSSEWLEPRRRHVDPGDVAVRELLKSYFAETINHPRWWYISSINQNEYYFPLKARTRSRSHSLSLIRFLESTASEKQPVERDKLRTGNALLRFFSLFFHATHPLVSVGQFGMFMGGRKTTGWSVTMPRRNFIIASANVGLLLLYQIYESIFVF